MEEYGAINFIGANVTKLRKDLKLTEVDVAEKLEISIVEYLRLETDPMNARIDTLFRTAGLLAVPPAAIIHSALEPTIMGFIEKNNELSLEVTKLQNEIIALQEKIINLYNGNNTGNDNE